MAFAAGGKIAWVHATLYAAGSSRCSISATLAPLCANSRAAVQPATLPPTTATSKSGGEVLLLRPYVAYLYVVYDVSPSARAIGKGMSVTPATHRWIERDTALGAGARRRSVEALGRRSGVTKGGSNWHFDDRRALLEEMLDAWERLVVDEVMERIEGGGGDARAKLRRLFALASSGRDLMKIELAVREWARRDKAVARRIRRIDNRRMEYMRSLFGAFCRDEDEVEVRCLLAFSVFIGIHFIAADHGSHSRADVLKLALKRLVA